MSLAARLEEVTGALRAGRYRDASAMTVAAAATPPGQPGELIALARQLAYFNETRELVALGRRALAKPSWSAAAEADLAAMISMAGEQDVALALLERSIRIAGPQPAWLYNRSQMHQYLGRFEAAEADLRAVVRASPDNDKAWWALGKLGVRLDDTQLDSLARRLAQATAGGAGIAYLGHALFMQYDLRDDTAAAWRALSRGAAAKRAQLSYQPEATTAHFRALASLPPPAVPPAGAAAPAFTPIFIVGMHRSGTTLLERILGGHPEVAEGGELYDFPAQLRWALGRHFAGASDPAVAEQAASIDFGAVGARYLERASWRRHGRAFLVDKLPSNFANLAYIARALPHARILHMRRAAMDTCFSNLKELFAAACPYSYDQGELARFHRDYSALMAHWRRSLPDRFLDVDYEALTADPDAEARRILAYCGLPWNPACLDTTGGGRAVNTASSAQVRRGIHRRSVGAWERYAAFLEPLRTALGADGAL